MGETVVDGTNQSAKMDDKEGTRSSPCLPVGEGEEAVEVKVLPSPTPPSRHESRDAGA